MAAINSLSVPCRLNLSSVLCARAQGEPPALPAMALASLRWACQSHTGLELVLLPLGMHMVCGSSMRPNSAGSSGAAATTAQAQAAPARLCRACERPNSVPSVYRQRALLVQQVWREWVHWLTWPSPGFSLLHSADQPLRRVLHVAKVFCCGKLESFQQKSASCSSAPPDGLTPALLGSPFPKGFLLINNRPQTYTLTGHIRLH